jgi:tRNA pseudouridine55 synthase
MDIAGTVRVYHEDGLFLGIAQAEADVLVPTMVFEPIS